MSNLTNDQIERIIEIVNDCEEIQDSNESQFTKQSSMITAYEEIAFIVTGRRE